MNNLQGPKNTSNAPTKRYYSWWVKAVFSLTATIIFLFFSELVCSLITLWIPENTPIKIQLNLDSKILTRDFDVGYINKPGTRYEIPNRFRICRFKINSFGFRDDNELDEDKHSGEYRVMCLGDSCTFGLTVDQNQDYPAQLEQILNERHNGRVYRVINAGCAGYTLFNVTRLLETRGELVKPDMVVISSGANDSKVRADGSDKARDFHSGPLAFVRKAIFYTNTYAVLGYLLQNIRGNQTDTGVLEPAVSLKDYDENLRRCIQLAHGMDAKVVFCPISVPTAYLSVMEKVATEETVELKDGEKALWRVFQIIANGTVQYGGYHVGSEVELPLMKLLEENAELSTEFKQVHTKSSVMDDSVHPNPIGNRAIAEDLAAVIP